MHKKYFVHLLDLDTASIFGAKALNLYYLANNGFDVPKTYCVNSNAYTDFIIENNLSGIITEILYDKSISHQLKSNKITTLIKHGTISQRLINSLCHHDSINFIDTKWAVRSSSNLEDLPETSFAGLYDTFLNVKGSDNILDAIKKCWASLWSERALVYREKNNLNHTLSIMAVLIQEMVCAETAGVVFTRSPDISNHNDLFLEYYEGIGESLVSGRITPYSCRINKLNLIIEHLKLPGEKIFAEDEIKKLTILALKVEKHFGCPQDIEWAFDGRTIFLLQTRPIPNLSHVESLPNEGVWTRANIGEVLPNVITPLTWDIFRATLMNCPRLALKPSNNEQVFDNGIRQIHGRGYIRLEFFLNSFSYLPFVTPKVMSKVLGTNLTTDIHSYLRPSGIRVRLAQLLFLLNAFKILPRLSWMIKKLPPLPQKDHNDLEAIITWNARCFHLHLKCTAYSIGAFALLSHLLDRWLPSEAENLIPLLLTGNENLQTAAQGISLWELSNYVRAHPDLKNILENDFNRPFTRHHAANVEGGPQFFSMLQTFLDVNGARAAEEFELAVPRWREDPTFVMDVIRNFLEAPVNGTIPLDPAVRHSKRQQAMSHIKSSLQPIQRLAFIQLLASYADFCTLRENVKYHLMEGYALLRNVFLEMGAILKSKGLLEHTKDVFFLRPSEIMAIFSGNQPEQKTTVLVSERKTQHAIWESQYAPNLIVTGALVESKSNGDALSGIGCSPGVVEGVARVLFDISEADTLEPGEILVAPHTDPGWTPLFLSCKAVVTEIGGFLSHGATVAREYGIPAVVNVKEVTQLVKTGDIIQVNGTKGIITIYESKS